MSIPTDDTTLVDTGTRPGAQGFVPPRGVTSRVLRDVGDELRAGRHPLVTGAVGDLVLLLGEAGPLPAAIEQLGMASFDVVLRVNAVDGICVVQGDETYERLLQDPSQSVGGDAGAADGAGDGETDADPRQRRLQSVLARLGDRGSEDVVASIRRCLTQCEASVLVVMDQADIILQDPSHHQQLDRDRVAGLQLALREAAFPEHARYRNTCVLIATNPAEVPSVLLGGCEVVGTVDVAAPSRREREAFLWGRLQTMHDACELEPAAQGRTVDQLARLTDGDSLCTLDALSEFSRRSRLSVLHPRTMVNRFRFGEQPDYWSHLGGSLVEARDGLLSRVFGQEPAVNAVMAALASAAMGLTLTGDRQTSESPPRGLLWFVGPTGVGKTELAKAVAEVVFGDPEAYYRLDMTTFREPHAVERLFGSPPGYVGFEQGGQLSNAVRRRPNQVILLDEIEKAHPAVLERLMSVIDDGRVTDAQGRVAYFGETIIIATSNVGADQLRALVERRGGDVTYDEIRMVSTAALREHFLELGRPEILGRVARGVVAFDILRPEMVDRIACKVLEDVRLTHGPRLEIDPVTTCAMARGAMEDPLLQMLGGRQVRTLIQQHMGSLTAWLGLNGHAGADVVEVRFDGQAMVVSVDGAPPVTLPPLA